MKNQGKSYDNIAEGFAGIRTEFATEKDYIDSFVSYLKPGAHILDMGCGTGTPIARYLLSVGFQVTGVDGSEELLKIAQAENTGMDTVLCDARKYEPKNRFDGIIEWWCLFHMPVDDQLAMIEKFYNWLKPGGILQFTSGEKAFEGTDSGMLDQPLDFFSADKAEYMKVIESHHFELLSCESDQENHLVWTLKRG